MNRCIHKYTKIYIYTRKNRLKKDICVYINIQKYTLLNIFEKINIQKILAKIIKNTSFLKLFSIYLNKLWSYTLRAKYNKISSYTAEYRNVTPLGNILIKRMTSEEYIFFFLDLLISSYFISLGLKSAFCFANALSRL